MYTFPHRTFQEYLAACHLTDHGFPDELADLLRADPGRWREVTLLAGAKAARGTASAAWNLAEALCFRDPPPEGYPESDCWGALLAAQTLLENERACLAQISERNTPKLERVRRWLLAIVTHGWLPPADRALAGEALAILGDDRDFDELVIVSAGLFLMGSTNADEMARPREMPQHEVLLPTFRIAKYPVTNGQYLRFAEATERIWRSEDGRRLDRANHPAVNMSWHDARAYCAWLTEVWRAEGIITSDEVARLPSAAEWEKAARGSKGWIYPWGNEWEDGNCNTVELGLGNTSPVGIFPKGVGPYGCLDMSGNIWEWTSSLWGTDVMKPDFDYPYDPADGREYLGAGSDVHRIVRGGSSDDSCRSARCAYYDRYNPYGHWNGCGFRVCVAPQQGQIMSKGHRGKMLKTHEPERLRERGKLNREQSRSENRSDMKLASRAATARAC